jgi:hypothetical protein
MALWNNNDREESKPTWLNKIAKRLCTRTVRGWEMPLMGSFFGYGETDAGDDKKGAIYTELLVTIPGAASRGSGGLDHALGGQGLTVSTDLPNYAPYFTCPFSGDSAVAGGPASAGVSHGSFTYVLDAGVTPGAGWGYQYGVNKYGVSSLGGLTGVTAYIKVCVNDANFTNTLSMGLSGTHNRFTLYTGESDLKDVTKVPGRVFDAFFGATSTDDHAQPYRYDNIGVLVAAGATANGNKTVSLKVNDGISGLTASTTFTLYFDRQAGATAAGKSTLNIADYTYYNYDKSR